MTTWPTLQGRLNQPLTSEKEALRQLAKVGGVYLSEYAIRKLEEYLEEDAAHEKMKNLTSQ